MREETIAQMMGLITGEWAAQAVNAAAELRLADVLARGPQDAAEVARAAGTHPDATARLLRALADLGVCRGQDGQKFELTELGELLRSDDPQSLRGFAVMIGSGFHRRAATDLAESVRTGTSAFERLFGGWRHFAEHPEDGRILDEGMTSATNALMAPALAAYDFAAHHTVVDVGGGQGALLASVLARHPECDGVLFDLPHVIAGAGGPLRDAGVAGRCALVGGDFFTEVPPGGDAYVLSNVIHDWDDDHAALILTNCRKAMNPAGRVVLCEGLLTGQPVPVSLVDLEMLIMADGARQRTREQVERLLARAGLGLTEIYTGSGPFSVLEAALA